MYYGHIQPPSKGADSGDAGGRHVKKGEEERKKKHCTPWNAVSCVLKKNFKYKAAICLKSLSISMFLNYALFAIEIPK